MLDVLVRDPEIRRDAQDAWPQPADEHSALCNACLRIALRDSHRRDVDADEVRLHRVDVDRQAGAGETLREPVRASVVLRETLDVVVERIERSRGNDARLAHRAAEQELAAPRSVDQLG